MKAAFGADPRFPREGVDTRGGAPHHYHLAKKGAKLHELEKKLDREEESASSALPSPLDPPL